MRLFAWTMLCWFATARENTVMFPVFWWLVLNPPTWTRPRHLRWR